MSFSIISNNNGQALLNALLGSTTGLTNFSVTARGDDSRAFGLFDDDPFGLGSGIVLSTGRVEDLPGINATQINGNQISGTRINTNLNGNDSVSLIVAFDADSTVDELVFEYVFGSEELPQYAGGNFNDSFDILLNGTSLARLSDGKFVAINNLAQGLNGPFHPDYRDNLRNSNFETQLDGLTKVLQFKGLLTANARNTLEFKIQDVGDEEYDSAVFIKGNSLRVPNPDLRVSTVNLNSTGRTLGQALNVSWVVTNDGEAATSTNASWSDRIYLSVDSELSADDILLTPLSTQTEIYSSSGRGSLYSKTATVALPTDINLEAPQFFYLLVQTDALGSQVESNEGNNATASSGLVLLPLPFADLTVSNVTTVGEGFAGQPIEIRWTITNSGTQDVSVPWTDAVYLSNDASIGGDQPIDSFLFEGTLRAGASIERRQIITLPTDLTGNYRVVVKADANNNVVERNRENNNGAIAAQAIDVRLTPSPNLQVTSVTAAPTALSGQTTQVEWTITNTGTGSTSAASWYDEVWLSLDNQWDASDRSLGSVLNASYLRNGESYVNRLTVTLPEDVDGNYYFLVQTDKSHQVSEFQGETDNFGVSDSAPGTVAKDSTAIQLTPPPDLIPTAITAPSVAFSGQAMTLNWTGINQGGGTTRQPVWRDGVYMSADTTLDPSDYFLGWYIHNQALDPLESYNASKTVTLPVGVSGDFYFLVATDDGEQVIEFAGDANNVGFSRRNDNDNDDQRTTVRLTPPPDLEVGFVVVPEAALASHKITLDYRVTNAGATVTPNFRWTDTFYLSSDDQFDPTTDRLLQRVNRFGTLDVIDSGAAFFYDRTATLTLPDGISGTYYLFALTDADNVVFELEKGNNHSRSNPITIASQPADLAVSEVSILGAPQAGKALRLNWTVNNQGPGATAVDRWIDQVFVSTDAVLSDDDVLLAEFQHNGALASQGTYERSKLIALPFNLSGNYHLLVKTDADTPALAAQVYEAGNEANNMATLPITVTQQLPDLQVSQVSTRTTARSGEMLTVNWTVQNREAERTNAQYWYDSVYLSRDAALDEQDVYLGQVLRSGTLDGLSAYNTAGTFKLPFEVTGEFHLIVRTDDIERSVTSDQRDRVFEGLREDNNNGVTTAQATIALGTVPNLVVSSVDAPANGISGQSIDVTWTVRNLGAATDSTWYDTFYLSRDQFFDRNSDTYLGYHLHENGLAANGDYTQTASFQLPVGFSGPFYVFAVTDSSDRVFEHIGERDNNGYGPRSMQVELAVPVDLTVAVDAGTLTLHANQQPGQDITLGYTITNLGPDAAQGSWADAIYLSADEQWDLQDAFLGRVAHTGTVGRGESYSGTITAPLPGVLPGDYHVIIRSDILNTLPETNETNNIGAILDRVSVTVPELLLDLPTSGTLAEGQSVYYRLEVAEGETLQVTFDSAAIDAFNELYIRRGQLPSRAEFDFGFEDIAADQSVIVPLTEAGTYYVLARGQSVPDGTQSYAITAETIDFGITSIGQTVGDRGGLITIELEGAKFTPWLTAALEDGPGRTIEASRIWFEDSTRVFATFDLRGAALGDYDLKVSQFQNRVTYPVAGDGSVEPIVTSELLTDVFIDGFKIIESRPEDVLISVTSTPSVRPGSDFDILVSYANRGTHDVTAPLIVVNADPDIRLMNIQDGDDFAQLGSMTLLGISNEGPAGILRPGETGLVRLRGTANLPANATSSTIAITALPVVDDGSAIDYTQFVQYLGGNVADNAWANATVALQKQFGKSWTTFGEALAQRATELATSSRYTHSATDLWTDIALDAWGEGRSKTISPASAIDNSSSAGEAGRSIQLFSVEHDSSSTDDMGFQLANSNASSDPAAEGSFYSDEIPANSEEWIEFAQTVAFDQNNIATLLEQYQFQAGSSADAATAFDILMQRVERRVLEIAEDVETGGRLPLGPLPYILPPPYGPILSLAERPPAPSAADNVRQFVGDLGFTTRIYSEAEQAQDVRRTITASNPKTPLWIVNEISDPADIGAEKEKDALAQWAVRRIQGLNPEPTDPPSLPSDPIYPFDYLFSHKHFAGSNNLLTEIIDSNEYEDDIRYIEDEIRYAVERGAFFIPPELGTYGPNIIDISEEGTYTFEPDEAPIIIGQGLRYSADPSLDALDDFYRQLDAFLALGAVDPKDTVAVINSISIESFDGYKTYTADIDYYGWDAYIWSVRDRGNSKGREAALFGRSGVDPAFFEYVWLIQQYGYGAPFTQSFEIDDIITGRIPSPDDDEPPTLPPFGLMPPTAEPPGSSNPPGSPVPGSSLPPGPWNTFTQVVASFDPNDILGPQGFGSERWVAASNRLDYTIRFENDPVFATAAAQVVRITQQLDLDLDFRTFRIGDFGFGETFIDVPDNRAFYQTRLDLTATKGLYVDVAAGIDVASGEAFWEFTSIDPLTGAQTSNALAGFLPPNLSNSEGEGFVSYSIRPKSTVTTGTVIDAEASIIFDNNAPIDTPPIFNTLDANAPTSAVTVLSPTTAETNFLVQWSGTDVVGGSAIANFTIYVSENGAAFTPWLRNTTLNEAIFVGKVGHTYAFYSQAQDNAGNLEAAPTRADAIVQIATPNTIAFGAAEFRVNEDGTPIAAVTAVRFGESRGAVSVTLTLSDDSAIAPADYDNAPILVSFADGETTKIVSLPIVDDGAIEPLEQLHLTLSNPTGGAILGLQSTATLTIADNDVFLAFSNTQFSVNENGSPITAVTVTRTGRSTGAVGASIELSNGTAIAPADYNNQPIVINFADGEMTKTVVVPIVNDTLIEPTEILSLRLTNPTGGASIGADNTATLVVVDDDVQLAFSASAFQIREDGTPIAPVTVTRTGQATGVVEARVTLSNGTAIAPGDYSSTAIPIRFEAGETSKTISVPIVNDLLVESNETINLTLTNVTGGATLGGQSTATLTIVDEDVQLNFSAPTFQVREDGTPIAAVTVTRTGRSTGTVGATLSLSNGTAIAPGDYTSTPINVILGNGEMSKVVTIPIVNDTLVESNETINLVLSNATGGATIGTQNTATLTIVEDDVQLAFSAPNFSVSEDGTPITAVTVSRTGRSTGTVGATVTLSNGTAITPGDYTSTPITVVLGNGEMSRVVTIPIANDTLIESAETINLTLTSPTGGATIGTQNTATLTIVDEDVQLTFSAPSFSVNENGTPINAVTVTRTGRTSGTVGATVALSNGTAIAPADYNNNTSINVVFASGETSKTVTIPIVNDTEIEANETIGLTLINPTGGATLGQQNAATLTINNDDFAQLAFSTPDFSAWENGTASVTVTRTGQGTGAVGATIALSNGTAIAPGDYDSKSIAVNFAAGETAPKTIAIPIFNDTWIESNETIELTLVNPTPGATIGTQNTATLTVLNDDATQLAFSSGAFSMVEDGTLLTAVTVTRTGQGTGAVGVSIALNNGSAVAGSDFNSTPINVYFGEFDFALKTIYVPVVNDTLQEGDETINLALYGATGGATIGAQSTAVLTIINNDFIGGAGNDALWGGPYNDYLAGNDGNDRLIGREGNDHLLGNAGDDELIGVAPGSATPGRGEIDRLVGGVGSDSFHLGSATAFYYNDGNSTTEGREDYAQIVGFNTSVDSIVLRGSASRYRLEGAPAGLPSGTAIYLLTSGQANELIGIVEGMSGLRLSDRYFSFV